jgi:hypothetical protein
MKPHQMTPSDRVAHERTLLELRNVLTRLQLAAIQIRWGLNELEATRITEAGAHVVLDEALAELAGWGW